jgi:hypothetical protein
MAYIAKRAGQGWEVRESHSTPDGPRSRTLASFRTLSDETIERARGRAAKPLSAARLRAAARRAGAPVELPAADRAAGELLRELAAGREPHPTLCRVLADALDAEPTTPLDNARAAAGWLTATAAERGRALHDLLLLADAIPSRGRRDRERFPGLGGVAA